MSDITYEFVSAAPVEAIVELYRSAGWWRENEASRAAIPAMIRGSFCFLVAKSPERDIVGMGRVLSDGASDAYIQDVAVLERFRQRGIGREIVRRLAERCREARIGWIGLVAEPGTQEFYEPLGFHVVAGHQLMLHRSKE